MQIHSNPHVYVVALYITGATSNKSFGPEATTIRSAPNNDLLSRPDSFKNPSALDAIGLLHMKLLFQGTKAVTQGANQTGDFR